LRHAVTGISAKCHHEPTDEKIPSNTYKLNI
jgi:hypothetical protein